MTSRAHFTKMTIIVKDPETTDPNSEIPLTEQVEVPADRLLPGPRSHRFHVVDIDLAGGDGEPADCFTEDDAGWEFADDFAKNFTRHKALMYNKFHAQNVYAIASRTLANFERLLGRRVPWAMNSPVLNLIPHAIAEANAYYSRDDQAVLFGYIPGKKSTRVYTCLSHDIIAHEVTHAILDGLRPRFIEPGLPDQAAFHEALADIVALLSVLSIQTAVDSILTEAKDRPGEIFLTDLTPERLKNTDLLGLAKEFGRSVHDGRKDALRRSVQLPLNTQWSDPNLSPEFTRPHRRAEVVVAAVIQAFLEMWTTRLDDYKTAAKQERSRKNEKLTLKKARVAEDGAKAAEHLLNMVVRSIDYLPPVELEFGDLIEAILVADEVVVPDDRYNYRSILERNFAALGITLPATNMTDEAKAQLGNFNYEFINLRALTTSKEEAYRFIWQNMEPLGLRSDIHLNVDRVITTQRTGPYGLVIEEIVVDYSQKVSVDAHKLKQLRINDAGLPDDTKVHLIGGGVIVFDQFGRVARHKAKRILDIDGPGEATDRQSRRLKHLVDQGLSGRSGDYGASLNVSRGERFASLHTEQGDQSW